MIKKILRRLSAFLICATLIFSTAAFTACAGSSSPSGEETGSGDSSQGGEDTGGGSSQGGEESGSGSSQGGEDTGGGDSSQGGEEISVDLTDEGIYFDFDLSKTVNSLNVESFNGTVTGIFTADGREIKSGFSQEENFLRVNKVIFDKLLDGKKYSECETISVKTSQNYLYKINVAICTKVINRVTELFSICGTEQSVDAYYILGADLDCEGAGTFQMIDTSIYRPIDRFDGGETYVGDIGFKGIFDGRGHTISNLTTNNGYNYLGGVFGQLCEGSVVKNVAFINITSNRYSALVGESTGFKGTIENVIVTASAGCPETDFKFLWRIEEGATIRNVIVAGFSEFSYTYSGGAIENLYGVVRNANNSYNNYDYNRYEDVSVMLSALAAINPFEDNAFISYDASQNVIQFGGITVISE